MTHSRTRTLLLLAAVATLLYLDHHNNMYRWSTWLTARWSTWFQGQPVDHYQILNVTRGASTAEIKRAFRRIASILHPDTSKTTCDTTELFYLAQNAYDVLIKNENRKKYNFLNPDAGKWTEEYTCDIYFCYRPFYIIKNDFIWPPRLFVWKSYPSGWYTIHQYWSVLTASVRS